MKVPRLRAKPIKLPAIMYQYYLHVALGGLRNTVRMLHSVGSHPNMYTRHASRKEIDQLEAEANGFVDCRSHLLSLKKHRPYEAIVFLAYPGMPTLPKMVKNSAMDAHSD